MFFSGTIFSLVVAQMAEARRASLGAVLAVLGTSSTSVLLGLLLYAGRRPGAKLGSTAIQIHVLCALAFAWILLLVAMVAQNVDECAWHVYGMRWGYRSTTTASCALITSADVITWFLVITLFAAAYATYRRAVMLHGTSTTTVPVATWRLANAGDVEGAIKI
ncbi:hypothetical protein C8R45DRAFT_1034802 [Mycena sanguinolenta]|nr:hypothetical protein C8R45DRAFT_1034802 [Mycena sanguinolenta]